MVAVTYYVVICFDRNAGDNLRAGAPREVRTARTAQLLVQSLAFGHAGVVAFRRTGDPAKGEFENAVILSQAGEVDLDALTG